MESIASDGHNFCAFSSVEKLRTHIAHKACLDALARHFHVDDGIKAHSICLDLVEGVDDLARITANVEDDRNPLLMKYLYYFLIVGDRKLLEIAGSQDVSCSGGI